MRKAADATGGKRPTRIVTDANTLISAVLGSKKKPPADIHALVDGALSDPTVAVIVCPHLLDETENACSRLRLARLVRADEIPDIMRWIPGGATLVADPSSVARVCRDPKGDYVVALAKEQRATIVPGDGDLAALKETASVPIVTPREYLDLSL